MQWMLAIDTCGVEGGVTVAVDGVVRAERKLPARGMQETLMSSISESLAEAGIGPGELNLLAVAHGPGSFTGVRIGVAAVKGLAEALGVPVIAVSRLRLLAGAAGEKTAWLDAGRGDVYVGQYRDGQIICEVMMSRSEAEAAGGNVVVTEEVLRGAGEWVALPSVVDLVEIAFEDAKHGRFADPLTLDSNYLRIPDAELALRAKSA